MFRPKNNQKHDVLHYENAIYSAFSKSGEILSLQDGTVVSLYRDAFSDELYVERYGKRYPCAMTSARKRPPIEDA